MIELKNPEEIKIMRQGGIIASKVLKKLSAAARNGTKTIELDKLARKLIKDENATPSFLGHNGYPAAICTSVNEEIVHGIPGPRALKDGDILGIDIGIFWKGYHTDTAVSIPVGNIEGSKRKLIEKTKESLDRAIEIIRPDIHLGDIQNRVQKIVEEAGYGVIKDLSGHGIGKKLQEYPSIPNFGKANTGPVLAIGSVIAIEPMVSLGDWHVKIKDDGWTVVIADGSYGAHFEHTVAVTPGGYEILTK